MRFAPSTGTFYPRDIEYSTLPIDLVDVPQADFDAAMAREPGSTLRLVDGRVVIIPPTPLSEAEQLAAAQAAAQAEIDAAAAQARNRHLTDIPGQSTVYQVKAEQARLFLAATEVDAPPYVAAEAAALGATPEEAARRIVAIATVWDNTVGPAIEAARVAGKAAAKAADSVMTARAAALTAVLALSAI